MRDPLFSRIFSGVLVFFCCIAVLPGNARAENAPSPRRIVEFMEIVGNPGSVANPASNETPQVDPLAEVISDDKKIIESVIKAYRAGNFAEIEAVYSEFAKDNARFKNGNLKLDAFYENLEVALEGDGKDNGIWEIESKKVEQWLKAYPKSRAGLTIRAFVAYKYGEMLLRVAQTPPKKTRPNGEPEVDNTAAFMALGGDAYLGQATKYLKEMKKSGNHDFELYRVMIGIAELQKWGRDDFEALVNQGLSLFPQSERLHIYAIRPLAEFWESSNVSLELERFAAKSVARTEKQQGNIMYARAYHAYLMTRGPLKFSSVKYDPVKMQQAFDDYFKQYPLDQFPASWGNAVQAQFVCLAGDKTKGRELFQKIGEENTYWVSEELYNRCRTWAARN